MSMQHKMAQGYQLSQPSMESRPQLAHLPPATSMYLHMISTLKDIAIVPEFTDQCYTLCLPHVNQFNHLLLKKPLGMNTLIKCLYLSVMIYTYIYVLLHVNLSVLSKVAELRLSNNICLQYLYGVILEKGTKLQ